MFIWLEVCCCVLLLVSFGIRHSSGLYLIPISDHIQTGREVFGFAIAIQFLMIGIGSPIFGAIADKYGSSMNIITGDGGFDFSIDFNKQEQLAYRMIFCEIVTALSIQKLGGTFICKIFDIYTNLTIQFIYLLGCSSRYGNQKHSK